VFFFFLRFVIDETPKFDFRFNLELEGLRLAM